MNKDDDKNTQSQVTKLVSDVLAGPPFYQVRCERCSAMAGPTVDGVYHRAHKCPWVVQ